MTFVVVAAFDNLAVFEDEDRVGVLDCRQSVGDDEDCTVVHQSVHPAFDRFSVRVSMELVASSRISTGGLGDCRSCDCQQLALSLGQVRAVSGDYRIVAVRQMLDKAVGELRRAFDFFIRRIEPPVTDIVADRSGEQVRILKNHRQRVAQDPPS